MNKKNLLPYSISLVIITAIITFTLTTLFGSNSVFSDERLTEAYLTLQANHYKPLNFDDLIEGAIRGMIESVGDPYSSFMNKEEHISFTESFSGSYSGVGLVLGGNLDDDYVTVVAPIEGTPAYRAGIVAGDKIILVDGEVVSSLKLEQATSLIRGPKGTIVTLTIIKTNESTPIDIEIMRETIKIDTVDSRMIEEVGYIRVSIFEAETLKDFREHLTEILLQNPVGLILDLRGNPGGTLEGSIEVANLFLENGQTIVHIEDRNGIKESITARQGTIDIPLVVLVDRGSASASEIVAGALKDNERATIIGTQTFGKGLIQGLFNLSKGAAIKTTVAHYLTPDGHNIDALGIEPNIIVENPREQLEEALRVFER
jgi:carboxyl-terminal processing protease